MHLCRSWYWKACLHLSPFYSVLPLWVGVSWGNSCYKPHFIWKFAACVWNISCSLWQKGFLCSHFRNWFMRPILDLERLDYRLNAVSYNWGRILEAIPATSCHRLFRRLIWMLLKQDFWISWSFFKLPGRELTNSKTDSCYSIVQHSFTLSRYHSFSVRKSSWLRYVKHLSLWRTYLIYSR